MKRASPTDPEELLALCERHEEGPSDEPFIAAVELERVKAALRELPYEQKLSLIQSAFYGRTAREISEAENVPIGTVKTRIRTALIKVRGALEVNDEH